MVSAVTSGYTWLKIERIWAILHQKQIFNGSHSFFGTSSARIIHVIPSQSRRYNCVAFILRKFNRNNNILNEMRPFVLQILEQKNTGQTEGDREIIQLTELILVASVSAVDESIFGNRFDVDRSTVTAISDVSRRRSPPNRSWRRLAVKTPSRTSLTTPTESSPSAASSCWRGTQQFSCRKKKNV